MLRKSKPESEVALESGDESVVIGLQQIPSLPVRFLLGESFQVYEALSQLHCDSGRGFALIR